MEEPPPVPPKDTPKSTKMDVDQTPASGPKRKREANDDTLYEHRNGHFEPIDTDAHTPKRTRSTLRQSGTDHSEDATPATQRNLRRKKKVNNLSNLNLRHAAEQQRQAREQKARDSKFQEGTLTDKPSAQPPSVFTRMIRTDSGNIKQIDELMEAYSDGSAEPDRSVELAVQQEKALLPQTVDQIAAAQTAQKEEAGGLFRFGRSFASSFHPVALWNKLWNETRDDLIRQTVEEAERKRSLKEEAEARYAQMKEAGQLGLKSVSNVSTDVLMSGDSSMPRDPGILIDGGRTSGDQRNVSSTSQLLMAPNKDDPSSHSGSEIPDTAPKSKGTFRSRFAFRKPSVSNLKDGLKRVKSDFNLTAAAGANRESSSSVSPVKADFEHPGLTHSQSKVDLKKQHKLSKRVSNLETKLQQARRELDVALVEASPAPKLGKKYERFTPQSTVKRHRFVPGKLPSLPSERLLMAEQLGFGDDEASPNKSRSEAELRRALDLSKAFDAFDVDEDDGEETVKARTDRDYPSRASSLFKLDTGNIAYLSLAETNNINQTKNKTSELTQFTSDISSNMDPNSVIGSRSDGSSGPAAKPAADYASLDAKLKALDKNVKAAKKPTTKSKKRKSTDDLDFKPGKTSTEDDDAEWSEANVNTTPRKKRKGNSRVNSSSPQQGKRAKAAAGKQGSPEQVSTMSATKDKHATRGADNDEEKYSEAEEDEDTMAGAVPNEAEAPTRRSMDSQGQPLEPLYEEEEETTIITSIHVPLKGAPSRPTAQATPARYVPRGIRSRSPAKRCLEETMSTRAAEAAQGRRPGRSNSPPPSGHTNEVGVTAMPGEGAIPVLPNGSGSIDTGAEGEKKTVEVKTGQKETWDWPEDVF